MKSLYCKRRHGESDQGAAVDLFADRTSTGTMRANQLRLYFASLCLCDDAGSTQTGTVRYPTGSAQSGTIRLKLLKIGAQLKITVRKVWLSFSETYPYQSEFAQIC